MDFGIIINDGSELFSELAIKENEKTLILYNWQRRAIKYFFKHEQAVLECATGVGKSFCAIHIMKELLKKHKDMWTLIVVPKNVILEKTWYKELYDNGFPIQDIGIYYGQIKEYGKITLTNMQNIHKIPLENYDFIIWDEVHNYGTKRMLKYLAYPFKYKLGLSATVERMDAAHWDILKHFDHNKFSYTAKQALDEGILNPFNFFNIGVKMDEETEVKYEQLTLELNTMVRMIGGWSMFNRCKDPVKKAQILKKMNARKQLILNYSKKFNVVKGICLKHKKDKILVFNEYNEQTNKCYWHLLDIGLPAKIVHSGIKPKEREQNLIDFKLNKFNILLTSKVLDEGYNLPSIDTAIIMAGNSTPKQTIQRMGRVLRKKDKISTLYQVYVCGTFEEVQAHRRAKTFKELCSEYDEGVVEE